MVFKDYSKIYNLLYADKDYNNESNYIVSLLNEFNINSGSNILEFGSGTGIHGDILAKNGFLIHGVEVSKDMINLSKNLNKNFKLNHGDIRNYVVDEKFDAVISLFHVLSYQSTNKDVSLVFKNAYNHLESEGLFLFDFWYTPAVYNLKPETRIKSVSNDEINAIRIADPVVIENKNLVDVNYNVFFKNKNDEKYSSFTERHTMRHFSIPEIEYMSKTHGFKVIRFEEFLTKKVPSQNTWGVCAVLKKI